MNQTGGWLSHGLKDKFYVILHSASKNVQYYSLNWNYWKSVFSVSWNWECKNWKIKSDFPHQRAKRMQNGYSIVYVWELCSRLKYRMTIIEGTDRHKTLKYGVNSIRGICWKCAPCLQRPSLEVHTEMETFIYIKYRMTSIRGMLCNEMKMHAMSAEAFIEGTHRHGYLCIHKGYTMSAETFIGGTDRHGYLCIHNVHTMSAGTFIGGTDRHGHLFILVYMYVINEK